MNRRSFLKNSIGALLFGTLTSNKVLASVVESLSSDSIDVLIYLIQNKKGEWKVKGTIWKDVNRARLSQFHYNLDTFKPLQVVDNKIANNVKENYWKEYNCSGRCSKNINYLSSKKSGINATKSGQLTNARINSYGRNHIMYKDWWKEHGKKIGELNKKNGHLNKLHKSLDKEHYVKMGKKGSEIVVREKLGIHSATKEQRSEWGKVSGIKGGYAKAAKYDMKAFSLLGQQKNREKYGKPVYAQNLITFEVKDFDSMGTASKYTNIQKHVIKKILEGTQPKTRNGWVFYKK